VPFISSPASPLCLQSGSSSISKGDNDLDLSPLGFSAPSLFVPFLLLVAREISPESSLNVQRWAPRVVCPREEATSSSRDESRAKQSGRSPFGRSWREKSLASRQASEQCNLLPRGGPDGRAASRFTAWHALLGHEESETPAKYYHRREQRDATRGHRGRLPGGAPAPFFAFPASDLWREFRARLHTARENSSRRRADPATSEPTLRPFPARGWILWCIRNTRDQLRPRENTLFLWSDRRSDSVCREEMCPVVKAGGRLPNLFVTMDTRIRILFLFRPKNLWQLQTLATFLMK